MQAGFYSPGGISKTQSVSEKQFIFFLVLRRNSLKEGLAGVPDKKSF
jgi:hypothetical protein